MTATRTYSTDNPFDASQWRAVEGFSDLTDITYHRHTGEGRANGIVRIAFDRPEVRNAFRPHTVDELYRVLDHARRTPDVGTVLLTRSEERRVGKEGRRPRVRNASNASS